MPEFLGAGVYVQEQRSGQQTVQGVGTSAAATVGWTPKGIENKAILITSFAEFQRTFGGFWSNSEVHFGVKGFFDNGGTRLYFVRVVPEDASRASSLMGSSWLLPMKWSGTQGNSFRMKVIGNDNFYNVDTASFSKFDIYIEEYDSENKRWEQVEGPFQNISFDEESDENYFPAVFNDEDKGSKNISIEEVSGGIPSEFEAVYVSGEILTAGDGGSEQSVSGTLASAQIAEGTFQLYVDSTMVAVDDDGFLSNEAESEYNSISGTIDYETGEFLINMIPSPANGSVIMAKYYKAGESIAYYTFAGGEDGTEVTNVQTVGAQLEEDSEGIYALDFIEESFALGIPDFSGDLVTDVALIAYAERRRDVFCPLVAPRGIDPQAAKKYFQKTLTSQSSFAAGYYPQVVMADPLNGNRGKVVSPVLHIAGRYAYTDINRNVAKAPAGVIDGQLQGVLRVERRLKKAEIDILYPAHINPIVEDSIKGKTLWGARTLQIQGDYRYLNHRRFYIFLSKSVERSTQDLVFEPVGEGLFAQTRYRVESFLRTLTQFGYFASTNPSKAYRVICDTTNNTQNTQEQGLLICDILVAMAVPAEFVLFRIERRLGEIE